MGMTLVHHQGQQRHRQQQQQQQGQRQQQQRRQQQKEQCQQQIQQQLQHQLQQQDQCQQQYQQQQEGQCQQQQQQRQQQQQDQCQEQLFHESFDTDSPSSPAAGHTAATGMPQYLGSDSTVGPLFSRYPHIQMQPIPLVEVDYKTNPKAKPPHSHSSLIYMAMQASEQPKVTLSTIYKWIKENFCYYRHAEPTWQNSIRHTLSLNKRFKKVPRQKDEPGRGGFWQINPDHSDMCVNRLFRRKKRFQGYQDTASTSSVNEDMSPEQKTLSPTVSRGTTRSTETLLDLDILAAACLEVFGGNCNTLEDLDLTSAVRVQECEMERKQQPTGEQERWWGGGEDTMNHQLSYGYMDLLFSEQSEVGEVQPLVEVTVGTETVPQALDQGFGLSEGFFTSTYDHPPPTTLTVL
ncbi:forkhead box protein J1-B-like [Gouania willdenowi]|nr:forkhead box protein J1-B-like [Gouania willdenowi]